MTYQFSRRLFLLSSAAAGLAACTPVARTRGASAASAGSEAAQARALYDAIFERMLVASPELSTGLGLDTGARAGLKSRLGDSSPAGRLNLYGPLVEAQPQLQAIDRSALTGRDRGWLDTARWFAERAAEVRTFDYGAIGGYNYPVPYVLSQLTGSYQSVPDFLDSQHKIETAQDAQAYLDRLDAFARNVDQEVQSARADAARGVIPPTYILDKALNQTRLLRQERGREAALVRSLVRRAREKNLAGDWEGRAVRIVDGPLAQALDRQLALLIEMRARAGTSPATGRLPDGERFYQTALRFHTSTSLTPEQAHRIGLDQVRQVSAEADALLRREGLTQGSVGARLTALGQQERHQYPNTDAGRAQLIADLNAHMNMVRARMPEVFSASTIPTTGMEIRRVPEAIQEGSPRAYAQGGSLDGSRPGAFYINLIDTKIWPKWSLPTLNHHESVPGHLWQGAIVNSAENIPLLHRSIGIPAFGEGWGLYAESLADEIGVYRDNPLGRLGMLQSFLYRAARIVMDTGMHAKGWERDATIRYFVDTVGLDPLSATSEVDRYVVWPGQATSYKLGHNEMLRIRDEARRRLGSRFDIKAFHDLVLLSGDMPLEVLAGMAREWDGGAVA
jgi:uncharacterized protein (DUF885 family)